MRHPHVTSGGRYPALRTIAVLHLIGALFVFGLCVWQAIRVVAWGNDGATTLFIGPTETAGAKVAAVACWLAVGFVGMILMFAAAELFKLFIDIEHNTRAAALGRPVAGDARVAGADGEVIVRDGPAIPFAGERKLLDGDETAEGALLRGH